MKKISYTFSFLFTFLLFLALFGVSEAAAPVITISATPNPVTYNGSVVVSGTVTNITSCTITGGTLGTKILNADGNFGFYATFLKSNATFSISCSGPGGSASNYVIVPVTPLPITVDISVGQTSVLSGNSTNISWSSTGADSCTVTKNGSVWNTSVPSTSLVTYNVPFQPFGIAFDGTNMWTGNRYNYTVGKISPNGVATTISPPIYGGYYPSPVDLAYDGTNMWTFNLYSTSIIKIAPDGSSTFYPTTTTYPPLDIAFDGMNMWTVNSNDRSVLKISPSGVITTYTGIGTGGGAETAYSGAENEGIAYDGTNMWVTNNDNSNTVTKITPTGVMTNYSLGADHNPEDIAFDGTNMWTVNMGSVASISKITPGGAVTTYNLSGYNYNSIVYDGTKMWVSDGYNNAVYTVATDGTATLVIQSGGYPGATGIAFDGANIWLTYYANSTVVKIDSHSISNSQSSGALSSATTFTATCTNSSGGSATKSVIVSTIPGITISLNAAATPIYSGNSTTISWSSTNANYCEVTKNGSPWATTTTIIYNSQFGTLGTGSGQFNGPKGIAVDSNGNIYVLDYSNYRIQKFSSSGVYLFQFGSYGSGAGQFRAPQGITTDSQGNVYVTDSTNYTIQKFSSSGTYISSFTPQSYYLQGMAIDSGGNIYVSDNYYNRITKLNSSGTYLSSFGYSGTGNGQFRTPRGVAIDSSGNLYIADSVNNRIQKFTSSGAYVSQFGSAGTGLGQFNTPSGITVDSAGNIYVTDMGNNRIQKFSPSGTYLSQFGSLGSGNGQFSNPYGITTDSSGNIYITDYSNNRIQKFSTPVSSNTSGSLPSGSISTSTTFTATCANSVSSGSQSTNVDIIISHPLHRHPFPQPQH